MLSWRLYFQKLQQNTSNNGNFEKKCTNEETYKLKGKQVKETQLNIHALFTSSLIVNIEIILMFFCNADIDRIRTK